MISRQATVFILASALGIAACSTADYVTLPAPRSESPVARAKGLLAGFGRRDITPPPGIAIAMWGPDGQIAAGHRHRLYARAMLLEDARGERIAFIVVDLGGTSPLLHRLAAAELDERGIRLGADRIIVSATHTHAGPAGYFESKVFNDQSAVLPGFDPSMADFLVDGIAGAVAEAHAELLPAVAAWDTVHVQGISKNRSLEAFLLNPESIDWIDSSMTRREQELAAVDAAWSMLRVDSCDEEWRDCRPRGAFSVFGVHGTGYPAANDLFDGDIFALAGRIVERHASALGAQVAAADPTPVVHLFANGATGDVSPNHASGTRCEEWQSLEPGWAIAGPRRPLLPEEWRYDEGRLAECLDAARMSVETLGRRLGSFGVRLFDKAGLRLSSDVFVERAFSTRNLRDTDSLFALCESPRFGSASVGGAEDGRTRLHHWRAGWLLSSGFEEGGKARVLSPRGCHAEKRLAFGLLQDLLAKGLNFPTHAQFSVVRIGSMALAALPIEPTVMAGHRIEQRVLASRIPGVEDALVLGFANGYLDYLTTREEYSAQHYEGGATIYGPNAAESITNEMGRLAESVARGDPIVVLKPFDVSPGGRRPYLATTFVRDAAPEAERRVVRSECNGNALSVTWIDDLPGALRPSEGKMVAVERPTSDGRWETLVEDDDSAVTVRIRGRESRDTARWQMDWQPVTLNDGRYVRFIPSGRYRVAVLPRSRGVERTRRLEEVVTCK